MATLPAPGNPDRSGRSELWRDPGAGSDARARDLLDRLSVAEKVAQLGSAWELPDPDADAGADPPAHEEPAAVGGAPVAPMSDAVSARRSTGSAGFADGIGQLTRVFGTVPMTAAAGTSRVRDRQWEIVATGRFGIPALVHEECLTGFTTLGATVYPAPPAWAATFDPDLVTRMAAAIGADLHAVGVHQGLAPLLDVVRDYRWGRVEETLGEDPYLVATIGTAYVRGLEQAGVVATAKHFAGYAASRGARNHAPVSMGPREFADVVLLPFEMAVRAGGLRSVMNSYTDVDGIPCAANHELLTRTLREDWGFTGTVVSDYGAVTFLQTMHGVAADPGAAAALALAAGLDVELPRTVCFGEPLLAEIGSGRLGEEVVDRAVLRVLRQKVELGLLDPDWGAVPGDRHDSTAPVRDLDSPTNRALAREVAEQSVVLLTNNGVLPLGPEVRRGRIAVVGPCADDAGTFMGCYSFANHVLPGYPELGMGVRADSFVEGLRAEFSAATIDYVQGCAVSDPDPAQPDRTGLAAAVAAARSAEICFVVVGDRAGMFGLGTSGEGCDAADLALPGIQAELVEQVLRTGITVVLVVVSGRPYALGAFADRAAAMIQAFMPGEEGGGALAGIVSGRVAPSGRLPLQLPRYAVGNTGTYLEPPLGQASGGISNLDPTPLFAFGHGLGYTTFDYSDLAVSPDRCPTDGAVDIAVTVANTGDRAGADVVQLYLHDVTAQVTRPVRQLAGYRRVTLPAGAAVRVTFTVHADRTAFTGLDLTRIVEPGAIEVAVGRSAVDLPLTGAFTLTGPLRQVGADRVLTTPSRVESMPA